MAHYETSSSDNKDTEERGKARYGSTSHGENSNPFNEMSSFKLFSDSDIMKATNDLSDSSLIGKGGFGSVYKGTIADVEVAIKILDTKSTQGANEFVQEMTVLKNLKHENLVMLMGACLELRALVYEYVPRGSLEDCLVNSPRFLTWKIRIRIVYEICSVLIFLHSRKPKPLVHGDLKPHNILLDANFHCKLSDFGLSRYLTEFSDNTGAYLQTKSINGTDCYIDPDYIEFGKLTPGCDVYSFGVTILRILTGQPPFRLYKKVRKACRSKSLMKIVDSTAGDWPVDIADNLAKFGVNCAKDNKDRLKFVTEISTYLGKHLAEIPRLSPFSPMGNACSRMDLPAIHAILVLARYEADEETPKELSFQMWTQEAIAALQIRKLGDIAFRDKDFKQAIECYSQFIDYMSDSPTVYVRRSLCHLMYDDYEDALRDALHAHILHPVWPAVLYMQAFVLTKLNLDSDATSVFNEAVELEERRQKEPDFLHLLREKSIVLYVSEKISL